MKLSKRLREGVGSDRKLDIDIAIAIKYWPDDFITTQWLDIRQDVSGQRPYDYPAPYYTSSLDAALKLYHTKPEVISTNPRIASAVALEEKGL
jgi:hypothetical protein